MTKLFLFIFISLICPTIQEQDYQAEVVYVHDGDTAFILKQGKRIKVRLHGIDSPELSQNYGTDAKKFAASLFEGKTVKVHELEADQYKRPVVELYLQDGTWLNEAIVKAGFAWYWERYSDSPDLARAHQQARNAKLGLWQDPNPTAPWEFRKNN